MHHRHWETIVLLFHFVCSFGFLFLSLVALCPLFLFMRRAGGRAADRASLALPLTVAKRRRRQARARAGAQQAEAETDRGKGKVNTRGNGPSQGERLTPGAVSTSVSQHTHTDTRPAACPTLCSLHSTAPTSATPVPVPPLDVVAIVSLFHPHAGAHAIELWR